MPRRARIVAAGYPMHVILRGIDRAAVFFEDEDRQFFLECLGAAGAEELVSLHAYVLMTNHVHLLMTAARDEGVAVVMKCVGQRVCPARQPDLSPHRWVVRRLVPFVAD